MIDITLHALACFDAVATEGGFQAAAHKLNRTHPTVYAAIKSLELQLGFALLDRKGYRVTLTEAGRAFHERAKGLLADAHTLRGFAETIARGEESELTIVIGDLCPSDKVLQLLQQFFKDNLRTRMHLHIEAISGPWERLLAREADLIIHHIDKSDQRIEYIDLNSVKLIPVVAPGTLPFPITNSLSPKQMRAFTQCTIRDTARSGTTRDYYLIEGAPSCTVADQLMKKELIMQGAAWGHMPDYLVEKELRSNKLVSIAGKHFKGGSVDIVAARLRNQPQGPVASRLWQFVKDNAVHFNQKVGRKKARPKM